MRITHTFKTATGGLLAHKSRSLLTILGIIIGITSIILIVSLGEGAQNLILKQIQSIGSKTIDINPGKQPEGPTDFLSAFSDSLKQRDLESLSSKTNVPHAAKIMPIVFGNQAITFGNQIFRPTVFGGTSLFSEIYDIYPSEGRLFTDEEIKSYANVIVIGDKVKTELFGNDEALDQKVRIKDKTFRVIGILPKAGQLSFLNFDQSVFLPYTTAQQYIFGIKHFNDIVIEADSEENVDITVEDIKRTLRNNHNITDPEKDDFFVQTQEDAIQTVSTITNALTLFLASVAAISLIVGGIGIMNIMLVSVTERTREIGLRKALGATEKNILTQFLLESVMLTATGGFIGILLGVSFSFFASVILSSTLGVSWDFSFPLNAALLGLGVAAGVGLVFGIYPARQAAKKNPIDALRYE